MKSILILSIFIITLKSSQALECMGCEITDNSQKCDFFYKCKKGIEMCQTLVSKVNGNYSIIMSCATKDHCGHDSVYQEGLEECRHREDDTECYSCCDHDQCNTLPAALKKLPKSIFGKFDEDEEKIADKILETADDSFEALEQEGYDDEDIKEIIKDENDLEEKEEKSKLNEEKEEKSDSNELKVENFESIEEKPNSDEENERKKFPYLDDDVEPETTTQKPQTTTEKIKNLKINSTSEVTAKKLNSSVVTTTKAPFRKTTLPKPQPVPHLNIDGTQIAFNPRFNTTTTSTTTERELEINDIADMIFPDRKINENNEDPRVVEAFEDKRDEKDSASIFGGSLVALLTCLIACITF